MIYSTLPLSIAIAPLQNLFNLLKVSLNDYLKYWSL